MSAPSGKLKCGWCGKSVSALKHLWSKKQTSGEPRCSTCAAKAKIREERAGN